MESFFDEEFERDVEEVKEKKEEYLRGKISLLSTLNDIENQDLEDEEKLLIRQNGHFVPE